MAVFCYRDRLIDNIPCRMTMLIPYTMNTFDVNDIVWKYWMFAQRFILRAFCIYNTKTNKQQCEYDADDHNVLFHR